MARLLVSLTVLAVLVGYVVSAATTFDRNAARFIKQQQSQQCVIGVHPDGTGDWYCGKPAQLPAGTTVLQEVEQ